MSAIGPDLPPHLLAKRKRQQEEETQNASAVAPGAKHSPSSDGQEKRRKVMGPAMPPAPLEERPAAPMATESTDSSDDDDDDDFGPSLPNADPDTRNENDAKRDGDGEDSTEGTEKKLQRDDWMMMPPKQDDLAARLDPTKQRPTKFNTGKGARSHNAAADDSSSWHETPEQKRKRLENEMMGISKPATAVEAPSERTLKRLQDKAAHKKIQEHNETRGPSLVEQHKESKGLEAEDDPSKRAFDREKDMASSSRISSSQKREMLNKAAGFSGKFSGGTYL